MSMQKGLSKGLLYTCMWHVHRLVQHRAAHAEWCAADQARLRSCKRRYEGRTTRSAAAEDVY
jgi:hypothetical protein